MSSIKFSIFIQWISVVDSASSVLVSILQFLLCNLASNFNLGNSFPGEDIVHFPLPCSEACHVTRYYQWDASRNVCSTSRQISSKRVAYLSFFFHLFCWLEYRHDFKMEANHYFREINQKETEFIFIRDEKKMHPLYLTKQHVGGSVIHKNLIVFDEFLFPACQLCEL